MVVSSDAAKEAEVGFQDCVSSCPTRQPHSKFQDLFTSQHSHFHEETNHQPADFNVVLHFQYS